MTTTLRKTAAALAALALAIIDVRAAACATADGPNLKGLQAFHIAVEDLRTNECGVAKESLITTIKSYLSQSPLNANGGAGTPLIYLRVMPLPDCSAAHVLLAVQAHANVDSTKVWVPLATIWDDGRLLGGRNEMPARIGRAVEALAKELVDDWSSVNR